jgi:copper chaperone CopZ
MKTKLTRLALLAALITSPALAGAKDITIAVKGMVCGFCAQGIEKKFRAQDSVEKVDVNLSQKWVKLTLKSGKDLADELIHSLLTEAGYTVEKIERK